MVAIRIFTAIKLVVTNAKAINHQYHIWHLAIREASRQRYKHKIFEVDEKSLCATIIFQPHAFPFLFIHIKK